MSETDAHGASELILTVARTRNRLVGQLEGGLSALHGLSYSEFLILGAIGAIPSGSMSRVDLAAAIGMTPSGATRALRPLKKLGFIANKRDARDARQTLSSLTPAGQELLKNAAISVEEIASRSLARAQFTKSQLATLVSLLNQLVGS